MSAPYYPPVKPYQWRTITPRKTIPVYPPPEPLTYPQLPSTPRQLPATSKFTLSTHIVPGAHLRTLPLVPTPPPLPSNSPKPERTARNEQVRAQLRTLTAPPVSSGHPRILWICLNRYVRKGAKGTGLTLFLAHATGFPKEIWEPTIQSMLNSPSSELIDEIWVWEAVQHGDSALLNRDSLGMWFDWADNGRDILNFLHYFIPATLTDSPLPTHLRRVIPRRHIIDRFMGSKIEHSLELDIHMVAALRETFAALENPKLFSSLILIDPVIIKPYDLEEHAHADSRTNNLIYGALSRREEWLSREDALTGFKKNPFFNVWDPKALEVYINHGLYETKDSTGQPIVKLKTPGIQEAVCFAGTLTQFETFQRLKDLDQSVELRWIVPGKPGAGELGAPGSTHLRVWVRPKNSSNVRILKAGHLIPQEAPQELAHEICGFIQRKYGHVETIKSNL
ncbi:hypothetical protein NP233_g8198 [Leucocoprinus birnbaumii]|uniref:Alpha/beta-hydrolase n=1 Tax=Leucocoprinus birnbaumii TaxID=56174 RepID=A0AAD5VMX1_9AGAR|nr:hypothetical protein NP233_g8198 [Leucocoprinus birnbaumii]